jgi:hypothetical protein
MIGESYRFPQNLSSQAERLLCFGYILSFSHQHVKIIIKVSVYWILLCSHCARRFGSDADTWPWSRPGSRTGRLSSHRDSEGQGDKVKFKLLNDTLWTFLNQVFWTPHMSCAPSCSAEHSIEQNWENCHSHITYENKIVRPMKTVQMEQGIRRRDTGEHGQSTSCSWKYFLNRIVVH